MEIQNTFNCDTTTILNAVSTAGALVKLDGVQLIPSPFLSIDLEKKFVSDKVVGGRYKIQLEGYIVGNSFNDVTVGGANANLSSVTKILNLGKKSKCVELEINCGQTFIKGQGLITSVSIPQGNSPTWVTSAQYTINIDLYTNNGAPVVDLSDNGLTDGCASKNLVLEDVSEKFSISVDELAFDWGMVSMNTAGITPPPSGFINRVGERQVKLSFNITAQGANIDQICIQNSGSNVFTGLDAAEKYISCRIDSLVTADLSKLSKIISGNQLNTELSDYTRNSNIISTLDFRTVEVDPISSSITLSGDIIYRPNGALCSSNVLTSVNVEKNTDSDGNEIRISGSVTGLINTGFAKGGLIKTSQWWNKLVNCDPPNPSRMNNANAFFQQFSSDANLKAIAQHADHATPDSIIDTCATSSGDIVLPCLSVKPSTTPSPSAGPCKYRLVSQQVGRDYAKGVINFTFIFSNKVDSLGIDGVTAVDINGVHDIPRDNIVEIVVPGRGAKGVLTQNLCCLSSDKWTFDVNLTLRNRDSSTKPLSTVTSLRECVKALIYKYIQDAGIVPNPIDNCWFITDNQETIGKSTYKYSVQYTRPSCP